MSLFERATDGAGAITSEEPRIIERFTVRGFGALTDAEETRARAADVLLRRCAAALGAGDRMTLTYTTDRCAGAGAAFVLDRREPARAAESLPSLLGDGAGLVLEGDTPEHVATDAECVTLPPPTVLVSALHSRIGFGEGHVSGRAPVVALTSSRWYAPHWLDRSLLDLRSSHSRSTLSLRVISRRLLASELSVLDALLRAHEAGALVVCEAGPWMAPEPAVADQVVAVLRSWLQDQDGIQIVTTIGGAPDPGLLQVLRRSLVADAAPRCSADHAARMLAHPIALDLSGCLPLGSPLPSLTPVTEDALRLLGPSLPAPDALRLPRHGVTVGTARLGAHEVDVRLTDRDRARHLLVVGGSGTGKSTMIAQAILSDIRRGEGVCVIDPHGELTTQLLHRIPVDRANKVHWVRPGLDGRTFGLNLLDFDSAVAAVAPSIISTEFLRIFDRLYDMRHVGGPMFEQYMRSALLLVMENSRRGGTLLDVVRVFEDGDFRRALVATCPNAVVVSFWTRVAQRATGESALTSMAPYITSKLNRFITAGLMRATLGQPVTTLDIPEILDARGILLFDLSVGALGVADVQLLGMIVLAKIYMFALARVAAHHAERPAVRLYIDEAQLFATDTLAENIAQGRKGGISFVLANQNLAQFRSTHDGDRLVQTLLGNVGSVVAFRVNPFDAETLGPLFHERFPRGELERLPDFHAAARLLVDGCPLDPFVMQTRLLPGTDRRGAVVQAQIRRRSHRFTRDIGTVNDDIDGGRLTSETSATGEEPCQ